MDRNRNRRRTRRCRLLSFMRLEERQVMDGVGIVHENEAPFFEIETLANEVSHQSFVDIRYLDHHDAAWSKSTKAWWQLDSTPRGPMRQSRGFDRMFFDNERFFGLVGEGEFSPRSVSIEFEPIIRVESSPSSAKVTAEPTPSRPSTVVQLTVQVASAPAPQTQAIPAAVNTSQTSAQSPASGPSNAVAPNNAPTAKLIPVAASRIAPNATSAIQAPLVGASVTSTVANATSSTMTMEQNRDLASRSFHSAHSTLNTSVNANHDALVSRGSQNHFGQTDSRLSSVDRMLQRTEAEKSVLRATRESSTTNQSNNSSGAAFGRKLNSTAEALSRWSNADFVEFAGLDAMEIMHAMSRLSDEPADDVTQEAGGLSNAVCWLWVAAGSSIATAVIDSWSRSKKKQNDADGSSIVVGTNPQIVAYTNIWSSHDRFID